jgi:hypothetical protein
VVQDGTGKYENSRLVVPLDMKYGELTAETDCVGEVQVHRGHSKLSRRGAAIQAEV